VVEGAEEEGQARGLVPGLVAALGPALGLGQALLGVLADVRYPGFATEMRGIQGRHAEASSR
jgi:hypothetical protein